MDKQKKALRCYSQFHLQHPSMPLISIEEKKEKGLKVFCIKFYRSISDIGWLEDISLRVVPYT